MAPPIVSCASRTSTSQPASTRALAATRPLGPEPITTASTLVVVTGSPWSCHECSAHKHPTSAARGNAPAADSGLFRRLFRLERVRLGVGADTHAGLRIRNVVSGLIGFVGTCFAVSCGHDL